VTNHTDTLFIGGEWASPHSTTTVTIISASTEEVIGTVPAADTVDADRAVAAARAAVDDPSGWSSWEPAQRADALERLAAALEKRADAIATTISAENGIPVAVTSSVEAVFPVASLRYYAELIRNTPVESTQASPFGNTTRVRREPVGVVLAIAPWNFPQTLSSTKVAPALAAGCAVILKPSPQTPLDSYIYAEAVEEAGLPAGVFNVVPAGDAVSEYLVNHPGIDKIAFTGSTTVGRSIAVAAAKLLRPVTLELGGKSAAIFLEDADLDLTTIGEQLFLSTLVGNGQTCYIGTRILAPRSRYDDVVDMFAGFAAHLNIGDPLDPTTQIGPMATSAHRARVEGYIATGRQDGARLVAGGGRPEHIDRGWFVQPTIFADVDNRSTIAREEIFGPVLSIIPYTDEDDAVRLANDSSFGLGGTVWTKDHDHGVDVARRIKTGSVGINTYLPDFSAPFGGVKDSGIGREFGPQGLDSYVQFKSIYNG
jgi:acyl-CoA reductase-like NAD-dependent aldehyde dehydrogenase